MSQGVKNGKGFEWAVARALKRHLNIDVRMDSSAQIAKSYFESLSPEDQARFDLSADVGIKFILEKERATIESKSPQEIFLMSDSEGKSGDVRDVILANKNAIFGISCKSNHEAYKHSRLSSRINWVAKWGLNPAGCTEEYWSDIRPLFSELAQIRTSSQGKALFRELPDLHGDFYKPVLQAFEEELRRQIQSQGTQQVAAGLASYVIGKNDFYKFISKPKELVVQKFNFNGSLAGSKSILPTKLLAIDSEEGSEHSINVRFDRGYVFNFRIHNASSRVEPSLKFDVQAIGLPASEIQQNHLSFN